MKRKPFRGFTVSINRTSLRKIAVFTIVGIIALFIFTGMLTSFNSGYGLASSSIHEFANHVSGESLVYLMGMENQYFTQTLPEESSIPNVSAIAFQMATSINPDDPRSLLRRELPGFAQFDGRIAVAGDRTDYTTMPVESAPPMEVIMAEREAAIRSLEELENPQTEEIVEPPQMTTGERQVVHIMHSHNRESFFPELNDADAPFHAEVNITLVGERLGQELEKRGIGTDVDTTDVQAIMSERGWQYARSYDAGREIVKEAIATNEDLEFFFEVHRDAVPRNITTVTINGVEYARTVFIVGQNNKTYEKNLALVEELHNRLEKHYPGLSRGVIVKGGAGSNGRYNQDLSENAILLEVGGYDNTLEEAFRTAEAFAEVFSEFYWEASKVDQTVEKN